MNCYFCHLPTAPWPCYETVLLQFREPGWDFETPFSQVITVAEPAHRECVEKAVNKFSLEAA